MRVQGPGTRESGACAGKIAVQRMCESTYELDPRLESLRGHGISTGGKLIGCGLELAQRLLWCVSLDGQKRKIVTRPAIGRKLRGFAERGFRVERPAPLRFDDAGQQKGFPIGRTGGGLVLAQRHVGTFPIVRRDQRSR